jgi:transcriptional regulator with XRE-family HTH domain
MPTKLSDTDSTPNIVLERLHAWGNAIYAARLRSRFTVADLCRRIGVSEATLRRMERGDPTVAAGTYLSALQSIGLIDIVVPRLPESLGTARGKRVRRSKLELEAEAGNDGHF